MAKDAYADLFRYVAQAESGGRDYDSAGRVVTSPKGAKGLMQVMDATNLDPGYGVRPAQNDSLEERTRVGQDYLKAMIGNYDGDLIKGLAAYNAGPGRVDAAIAAAGKAGSPDWMSFLPAGVQAETVPYVRKIVGNMGAQPGMLDRIASAVMPSAQAQSMPQGAPDPYQDILNGKYVAPAASALASPSDDPYQAILDGSYAPPSVTESRSPDGALRLEMGGVAPSAVPQEHTGVLGAIEGLGGGLRKMGEGIAQGFADIPAGIGQAGMHQGQQILSGVDQLLGTSLADQAAQNVAARDAEVAQREAAYQAATPGSIAAGIGRVGGNLAFSLAGGPAAMAAPMMSGSQMGARLLPGAPSLGRLLGAGVGSGIQGAGYGAVAPVAADDYDQQSLVNTKAGAILGAIAPAAVQAVGAAGRYLGNTARNLVAPFTEAGQNRIAADILGRAARGGGNAGDAAQLVPGSAPTLAEITGNPGVATLQRTMQNLNPVPFAARDEANAAARLGAFGGIAGDTATLEAARAARASTANNLYGLAASSYDGANLTPYLKGQITQLLKRPSIDKASRTAQRWAIERGERPEPNGSFAGLHDVKTALDDMIGKAVQKGQGGEARALQGTKDKLLYVLERLSPDYRAASQTYAQMSRPINQMETLQGLQLLDAQGNITLSKVQDAIRGIERRIAAPGVNPAKSLDADQLGVLHAIRDDLLRGARTGAGRSAGSPTAQNLATQNMLAQALPGRVGAFAGRAPSGSLGATVGGGLGYMVGGFPGAAIGASAGGHVGRIASGVMNANNDAIQGALVRMLLNEGGSGLAALQRAAGGPRPITDMGSLQRLLYPAISASGSLGLGRLPANNGNTVPAIPNAF